MYRDVAFFSNQHAAAPTVLDGVNGVRHSNVLIGIMAHHGIAKAPLRFVQVFMICYHGIAKAKKNKLNLIELSGQVFCDISNKIPNNPEIGKFY